MKRTFPFLIVLVAVTTIFAGCKRGIDDPGLSFSSRDGRLIATWKLTNWEETNTTTSGGTTVTTTTSYDGTTRTVTAAGFNFTESYSLEIIFGKDASLTVTEVVDGDIESDVTNWQWVNSDKNKSFVLLNSSVFGGMFYVQRLASKELILSMNTSEVDDPSGNSLTTSSDSMKLTFEAI